MWMNNRAIIAKTRVERHKMMAIIDTRCLRVIILKGCMSRLGLEADAEINLTLNTADRTAEKQRLVFEKMKIRVKRIFIVLPVIVVDGSYFDLLLG